MDKFFDFCIDIPEKRKIRVLQLTDFQPVDPSQQRYVGRLGDTPIQEFTWEMKYEGMYYYIEKMIKNNNPDLILVTGDIVYGEFDDNGSNLMEICEFMDSFKIPWAPVFGNHDNECKLGVSWQCEVFKKSEYCLFERNDITGNGNYTIGLKVCGELERVIFMMDSNGCWHGKSYGYLENYPPYNLDERITREGGIHPDQKEWIEEVSRKIDNAYGKNIKKIAAMHIPPDIINEYSYINGYQSNNDGANKELYTLEKDVKALNGDFGTKGERYSCFPTKDLWDVLKRNYFTHLFAGHDHVNDISILCDTIRVTFGVKTGLFDYHDKSGGTMIYLDNGNTKIEHQYIDKK